MSKSNMETLSIKVDKPVRFLLDKCLEQNGVKQKDFITLSIALLALESGSINNSEINEYLPESMNKVFDLAEKSVNRRQHKDIIEQNKALFDLLKSFRPDRPSKEYMKEQFAKIKLRDGEEFNVEVAVREIQRKNKKFRDYVERDREILRAYYNIFRDEIDKKVLELNNFNKN